VHQSNPIQFNRVQSSPVPSLQGGGARARVCVCVLAISRTGALECRERVWRGQRGMRGRSKSHCFAVLAFLQVSFPPPPPCVRLEHPAHGYRGIRHRNTNAQIVTGISCEKKKKEKKKKMMMIHLLLARGRKEREIEMVRIVRDERGQSPVAENVICAGLRVRRRMSQKPCILLTGASAACLLIQSPKSDPSAVVHM
jgi:hypothetical protein